MKRLHEADINTPEHFDRIWATPDQHRYDVERIRAVLASAPMFGICIDVGCGCFGVAEYDVAIARKSTPRRSIWHAIDFSPVALDHVDRVAPSVYTQAADIRSMPFPNSKFDYVCSCETIEHMEKPIEFVAELARVCCSGGTIVITTVDPHCADGKGIDYPEHLWEFTPGELLDMFEHHGPSTFRRVGNYFMVECRKR